MKGNYEKVVPEEHVHVVPKGHTLWIPFGHIPIITFFASDTADSRPTCELIVKPVLTESDEVPAAVQDFIKCSNLKHFSKVEDNKHWTDTSKQVKEFYSE